MQLLKLPKEFWSKCLPANIHAILIKNCYSAIFNHPERLQSEFPVPVCQCVQIKPLAAQSTGNPERYRVVLSDIKNFVQSMLATGLSVFIVYVQQ